MTAFATLRVVMYEGAGSRALDEGVRAGALARLLDQGYGVTRVTGGNAAAAPGTGALAVLGRFEAAPPASGDADGRRVFFSDVEGLSADEIVARVTSLHGQTGTSPRPKWKPWFPVIDFSRCTNFMQCLTFCLFDVYGVNKEKKIEVRNPINCKTDCPACSRVCPEVAILFPKYKGGPINGDEVR